jgi:hypothetical protein
MQLWHHFAFVSIVTLGAFGTTLGRAAPACAYPAPLHDGARTSPQGFTVKLKASVTDPKAAVSALEGRHGFKITEHWWYGTYSAFFVFDVPAQLIDALRCEPEVESVRYDALARPTALAPNNRSRGP